MRLSVLVRTNHTRHAIRASHAGRYCNTLRSSFPLSNSQSAIGDSINCLIRLICWSITAMASSQVTKPIFPVEVWSTVFSNFKKDQDLVHLWTDCRHVCRQFRDDVERIFISKHLKKTTIDFDCGRSALKA